MGEVRYLNTGLQKSIRRLVADFAVHNGGNDDDGGDSGIGELKIGETGVLGLPEESKNQENQRRDLEQAGHKKIAKVNARDRDRPEREPGMGDGLQQHPLLKDSQRFDGIDPSVSPDPYISPDALWEFENARQEQELQKQQRLQNTKQNQHQNNYTPTFKPGG